MNLCSISIYLSPSPFHEYECVFNRRWTLASNFSEQRSNVNCYFFSPGVWLLWMKYNGRQQITACKFELCGRPLKIYDNGNADRKPHYLAESVESSSGFILLHFFVFSMHSKYYGNYCPDEEHFLVECSLWSMRCSVQGAGCSGVSEHISLVAQSNGFNEMHSSDRQKEHNRIWSEFGKFRCLLTGSDDF